MKLSTLSLICFILCLTFTSKAQYGDAYHKPNTAQLESNRRAREQANSDAHHKAVSRPQGSSYSNGVNKQAVKELADAWRTKSSGRPTSEEAEAARKAAEPARLAKEAADKAELKKSDALMAKWKAEKEERAPTLIPIKKQIIAAGFFDDEALSISNVLTVDAVSGQINITEKRALIYTNAIEAKRSFDKLLQTASYEELQPLVDKFMFAGKTAYNAMLQLRKRFPEKEAAMRPYELAAIGVVLGSYYNPYEPLFNVNADETMKNTVRERYWKIYHQAPDEALASCGHYSMESGCPIIYQIMVWQKNKGDLPYKKTSEQKDTEKKLEDLIVKFQNLLLKIKFDLYSDRSQKDLIEVRLACLAIAENTDRFRGYSNEDWKVMAAAQRKTPKEFVQYIVQRNSGMHGSDKAGKKIINQLEKAGIN